MNILRLNNYKLFCILKISIDSNFFNFNVNVNKPNIKNNLTFTMTLYIK